ncbi:MAG: hypothetical protein M1820_008256 [Bogoriella megaspora]|nr:MAG: hypothetical protein M1820_008256 [Bogoriella megaspora]
MSSEHKALFLTALHTPLSSGTRPTPTPTQNEVLVRVLAAGLNPHDSLGKETGLFTKSFLPRAILATDVVGRVTALGPGVTKYREGDVVMTQSKLVPEDTLPDTAGLQEFAIVDVRHSCKVPKGVGVDEAGTVSGNPIAAYIALFHPEQLGFTPPLPGKPKAEYENDALLVVGGGSQTGRFGIQFAKLAGVGKIIVVAGKKGEAELRKLGATHVVDRHGSDDDIEKEVRAIVGDELVYAYDTIGAGADDAPEAPVATLALKCLSKSKFGKLSTLLPGGDDVEAAKMKKGGYQKKYASGATFEHPDLMLPYWDALPTWLGNGDIVPGAYEVVEGLNPEKVNACLDAYRDGKNQIKPSVHP